MITDIFPTLVDLLDLKQVASDTALEGKSLAATWNGFDLKSRLRFTVGDRHTAFGSEARKNYENPKEIALQSLDTKVVFDFSSKKISYYDLLRDPKENSPLSSAPTKGEPPWRRQLRNWYDALPKYEAKSGEISDEDRKQLESMGYVGAP